MESTENNETSATEKKNPPVLLVTTQHRKDYHWTKECVQQLRDIGFQEVYMITVSKSVYSELDTLMPIVQKILIVLSKHSSRNDRFRKIIYDIESTIFDHKLVCVLIPVLLDEKVMMPMPLNSIIPFYAGIDDFSKLVNCLLVSSEKQDFQYFSRTPTNFALPEDRCRRLNSMIFPEEKSEQSMTVAAKVLKSWGLELSKECLSIDMNTLQNVASYQRICLKDLYQEFFAYHRIRFFRISGVRKFNFSPLFHNTQVYDDLTSVYEIVYRATTKDNTLRFWYSYRRNGLRPSDNAERSFKPLLDAKSQLLKNKAYSSNFSTYESRLKTLENFPIQSQDARDLIAKAGFFSINKLDYIQCYFCGQCLRVWNINQQRQDIYFENCEMAQKKREISNIIKSKEFRDKIAGISFDNLLTRIATFVMLDRQKKSYDTNHLAMFAQAGFYYLGINEDMLCYDCCLGLTKINEFKNPWAVHYKFSPDCPHLRPIKEKLKHVVTNELECNEDYLEYLEIDLCTYTDA